MEKYDVSGMHCAACSARVEKAVMAVKGVTACTVSLLTNSMTVEGTADDIAIINAVEKAGYTAEKAGGEKRAAGEENTEKDAEVARVRMRLILSSFFLLPLMYLSMGHTMLSLPVPSFLEGNPIAVALLQLLFSGIILVLSRSFFINGALGLIRRAPNMDTLVALGSGASFLYSTCLTFLMTRSSSPMALLHGLYFESAAMILVLITVGKMLEARAKGKTTDALRGLVRLAPRTAILWQNGVETEVPLEKIQKGDIFIVKSGAHIPADGEIIEGYATINEAALTGESMPAEKSAGAPVFTGTTCSTGYIRCRATATGEDTTLSQIIALVSSAAASKAPIAKMADRVSGVFVPIVLAVAFLSAFLWLLLGQSIGFALTRAISVLVISCPCALGLATPVAIMVGSGVGAKNGILFKTAASLEMAGRISIVALDKTGTITTGTPVVTDILPEEGITERELLTLCCSLEAKSEHPLSRAILKKAEEMALSPYAAEDFTVHAGGGLSARINGKPAFFGNLRFLEKQVGDVGLFAAQADRLAAEGKTPLFFVYDGAPFGIVAVQDAPKEDSKRAIAALRKMGIYTVMLTGDTEKTARAVAGAVGVDEVIADVMPHEKEAHLRALCHRGKTAMVGDGINDAPALCRADLGMAIGAGTDIAIDAADVVLMRSQLSDAVAAIRLGRGTLRNIRENLFWAFIYNTLGIPLAAGAFLPLWGIELSPMLGALFMSLSSFSVVSNALRLYSLSIYDVKTKKRKGKGQMEKVLKIEGMMCPHCEGRVQKALEALPGVEKAVCSHESGTARLTLSDVVSDAVLCETVRAEGYEVQL